jgi:hypothetical protein
MERLTRVCDPGWPENHAGKIRVFKWGFASERLTFMILLSSSGIGSVIGMLGMC